MTDNDKDICIINMPWEIVHSIICAAAGSIDDPSMFDSTHRNQIHEKLNEIIDKIVRS